MRITKCDVCNREIAGDPLRISRGLNPALELCEECAAPVLDFLSEQDNFKSKLKKLEKTSDS